MKYLRILNTPEYNEHSEKKVVNAASSTHSFRMCLCRNSSIEFGYYCESDLSRRNS